MKNQKYFPFLPNKHTSRNTLFFLVFATFALGVIFFAITNDTPEMAYPANQGTNTQTARIGLPKPTGLDPICGLTDVVCEGEPDADFDAAEKMLTGTPMAGLGKAIVETANAKDIPWQLVIGIAEAESNRGKSMVNKVDYSCHNAWGIKANTPTGQRGDGSWLRCYYTWQDGINTIVNTLARGYRGMTLTQMAHKYVASGEPHESNWIRNVSKFYQSTNPKGVL